MTYHPSTSPMIIRCNRDNRNKNLKRALFFLGLAAAVAWLGFAIGAF